MFKNYDLKVVSIGCFNGVYTGGYATMGNDGIVKRIINAELDEKSLKEIICIVDHTNSNAVDIFTGEFYHILKKDENNRIIESPKCIEVNKYYALRIKSNKMPTESIIYMAYCNYLANRTFTQYQKSFNQKVKVLTKNNPKES